MKTANLLINFQNQKTPQTVRANPARNISEQLIYGGGPFSRLGGMLLGIKADNVDAANNAAALESARQRQLAERLMNWQREDDVAERGRGWQVQDTQAAQAFDLDKLTRQQEYDRQKQQADQAYGRSVQETAHGYDVDKLKEQFDLARQSAEQDFNRERELSAARSEKEAKQKYLERLTPVMQKKLSPEDYQQWVDDPQQQVVTRSWLNPLGLLGKRNYLKSKGQSQNPYAQLSDEDLLKGL